VALGADSAVIDGEAVCGDAMPAWPFSTSSIPWRSRKDDFVACTMDGQDLPERRSERVERWNGCRARLRAPDIPRSRARGLFVRGVHDADQLRGRAPDVGKRAQEGLCRFVGRFGITQCNPKRSAGKSAQCAAAIPTTIPRGRGALKLSLDLGYSWHRRRTGIASSRYRARGQPI
jgi:hypothetical protein